MTAQIKEGEDGVKSEDLRTQWLEEHDKKLKDLYDTLEGINQRVESLGPEVEQRIQSAEFLGTARRAFRTWDQAETAEKRRYVANLITNCAGTKLCSDDLVRLFTSWLDQFHESHFAVIREILANPGSTRFDIWLGIHGGDEDTLPREDSAEADLYKMLIRDLSIGGVIRQARDTDEAGRFVRKRTPKRRNNAPATLESAFEDKKPYVFTDLGKQFVHYTMNETIGRLA